jgi:hypothetical protein
VYAPMTLDVSLAPKAFKKVKTLLIQGHGKTGIPLAYVIKHHLKLMVAILGSVTTQTLYSGHSIMYSSRRDYLISRKYLDLMSRPRLTILASS